MRGTEADFLLFSATKGQYVKKKEKNENFFPPHNNSSWYWWHGHTRNVWFAEVDALMSNSRVAGCSTLPGPILPNPRRFNPLYVFCCLVNKGVRSG